MNFKSHYVMVLKYHYVIGLDLPVEIENQFQAEQKLSNPPDWWRHHRHHRMTFYSPLWAKVIHMFRFVLWQWIELNGRLRESSRSWKEKWTVLVAENFTWANLNNFLQTVHLNNIWNRQNNPLVRFRWIIWRYAKNIIRCGARDQKYNLNE